MKDHDHELFETETMAELCARQGRPHEAMTIYRRLVGAHPTSDRNRLWSARLEALERAWGRTLAAEAQPLPLALPEAPGVRLSANDDSVTVAWAVAPTTPSPHLEVLLIHKTAAGVETTKRRVTLDAPSGRIAFAVPGLHSALAAVGQTRGNRFVPVARTAL